jgi:hypothetical protein
MMSIEDSGIDVFSQDPFEAGSIVSVWIWVILVRFLVGS